MKRTTLLLTALLVAAWALPASSLADKSSVTIEAPATAAMGAEVPVKILVKHKGNSFMHYTNRVELQVNGRTVERWEYSATNRPEDETFSREVLLKVDGPLEIVGQASCNIHGSAGPSSVQVTPVPVVSEEEGGLP
jgi:desulfoferrodoxin (superoxide reductase-like protein)